MRLSKILWFASDKQINYVTRPSSLNFFFIQSPSLFSYLNHSLTAQGSDHPFFTQECGCNDIRAEFINCRKTLLAGIMHTRTIICRQLFAGHIAGSPSMKRKNKLHWMIIIDVCLDWQTHFSTYVQQLHVHRCTVLCYHIVQVLILKRCVLEV